MKIIFQSNFQASSDFDKIIDKAALDEVKKKNPKPIVKKFAVAHEGMSTPMILGKGPTRISWPRKVISTIKDKIKSGIQCIAGHTKDNIEAGEKVLASIVGKGEEIINGILSTVVAVAFLDNSESDYDVISMESNLTWNESGQAESISDVLRFALGRSGQNSPAFPGAVELGSIQCFNNITKENFEGNHTMEITFNQVKDWLSQNPGCWPSQLFPMSKITGDVTITNGKLNFRGGDREVTEYISQQVTSAIPQDYDEIKGKLVEIQEKNNKMDAYYKKALKAEAGERVIEFAKKLNLDDRTQAFLKKRLDLFTASDINDKEIKDFVDRQVVEYKELTEIFSAGQTPQTEQTLTNPATPANTGAYPNNNQI